MSTPMTVSQWVAQAKKWGVPLNVVGKPETHNRNRQGRWGDVKCFVWHHFGSVSPDSRDLPLIVNGYSGLPGPLSQLFLGDDNMVDLVSTGRCNHAGKGARNTYDAVLSENYSGTINPGPDSVDFNALSYGMEIGYSGTEWMGDQRYKNALLISAAICDFHGWSEKSVIAHYELTKRKWDPGFQGRRYDMAKVRNDIRILLKNGPSRSAATVSTAKPPVQPMPTCPPGWSPSKNVVQGSVFGAQSTWRDHGVYADPAHPLSVSEFNRALEAGKAGATGQRHGAEREVWAVEQALKRLGFLSPQYSEDKSAGTSTQDGLNKFRAMRLGLKGSDATGSAGVYSLDNLMWQSGIKAVWK